MTTPIDGVLAMTTEHEAWQEMLNRLATAIGAPRSEFNHPGWNPFIDQVRYWGETLVAVRELHEPSMAARALAEAKELAENGR